MRAQYRALCTITVKTPNSIKKLHTSNATNHKSINKPKKVGIHSLVLDHGSRQQCYKSIASRDQEFQSIYIKLIGFYKLNKYGRSILFRFDQVKKCFTSNSG